MNELIKISYQNENPTVLGRELHEALEVKTAYKDWFPRMCEYGFTENVDFNPLKNEQVQIEGSRKVCREFIDHQLTIQMAKEICMIQRTEKGKQCRQYFLQLEQAWNSPEAIMSRALQFANRKLESLTTQIAVKDQVIQELQPKATYYDLILNCKDLLATTKIAKDYGKSAVWLNNLLHELGIQFKQSDIWLLYQKHADKGYTSTKTHTYNKDDGTYGAKVHTYWTQKGRLFIYSLLKENGYLPLIELDEISA